MIEKATDKKSESINALKNANKHLGELFTDLNRKDGMLQSCSADLRYLAKQVGEIQVMVYVGNERKTVFLKTYLDTIATNLESVRS